ncbi:RNA-guided endonuclease TnpB family protein [Hydrogenivirga sp. 128-5-R1-1]|uniref:RNA-guided endonuclease InsQ/TnpB family protein n=1 Tax=Hydrogenivirga sp. 128-5-R1-1 TaxID=392423 RepID=UPI00015F1444|nr:RNA-guided endonuclease TnpB family protein [Hydrogenivirga sp. 128-5-R1-1]EDP73587.1 ISChy8, transposase [Hydrogenivirga sp. 128-5-R1-1]
MKRIIKVRLYPIKEQRNVLKELQIRCSKLYNYANYLTRQNYFKTGNIYNYNTLCKLLKDTKDYKALPSDIAQEVLKKLSEDWKSFKQLKELQKKGKLPPHIEKVSPPKYKKNRKLNKTIPMNIFIKSSRSYKLTDYGFEFATPRDLSNKRLFILAKYNIPYKQYSLKRAEIINKSGKWYVYISIEIPESQNKKNRRNYASIDFGARNLIAVAIYREKQKTVNIYQFKSKELWKEFKYWDRQIEKYQSKINKQGIHKTRRLKRLYDKREKRIKQAINSMINKLIELLNRYNVKTLYIGDLTGIRDNIDYGKYLNKLLHNFWIRSKIQTQIEYKAKAEGIEIISIPEYYTSSKCIVCDSKTERPVRSVVICKECKTKIHSDTLGAINILFRGIGKDINIKKINEIHFVFRYKQINRWIFVYKRYYEQTTNKEWTGNQPAFRLINAYKNIPTFLKVGS